MTITNNLRNVHKGKRVKFSKVLCSELGMLQARLYWLHDAEAFADLAATAGRLYGHLGHSHAVSEQAGALIAEAYEIADQAQLAREAEDGALEVDHYGRAQSKLAAAAALLGFPVEIADHQVHWWMAFRHRKLLQALWHLFQQHHQPLGFAHFIDSIRITYCLLQVGLGHNRRDFAKCEHYATRYWAILLNLRQDGCPYLG